MLLAILKEQQLHATNHLILLTIYKKKEAE